MGGRPPFERCGSRQRDARFSTTHGSPVSAINAGMGGTRKSVSENERNVMIEELKNVCAFLACT